MREILKIPASDIKPDKDDVLKAQGIPSGSEPPEDVKTLFSRAVDLFLAFSQPVGLVSEISIPEFETVYHGEGLNEQETPLNAIFKKADSLLLFALSIGEKVTEKIDELFRKNEFALGSMLDSVASVGTDKGADSIEEWFFDLLSKKEKITPSTAILRFSPGYCGWHMSGQKKLFEFLRPENIGIILLDSYLMKPLKSISGLIVAGNKEIFIFDDSYPFCNECKTHSCRDRMGAL
jgi:hypothetical protein